MEHAARRLWFKFGTVADLSGVAAVAVLRSCRLALKATEGVYALASGAGVNGVGQR